MSYMIVMRMQVCCIRDEARRYHTKKNRDSVKEEMYYVEAGIHTLVHRVAAPESSEFVTSPSTRRGGMPLPTNLAFA